jgi:cystathionine beta-lyase
LAKKVSINYKKREGTNSLKWDGYSTVFHRNDLLPLWVADMDFEIAKPIQKAIKSRQTHSIYGYPVVDDSFYEAIMDWHLRRYGTKIKKADIVPLNGVVSAIFASLIAFSTNNEKVALFSPVYGPFFSVPSSIGREIVDIKLASNIGGFEIDFELFESELQMYRPKILIFCHPHNPIGKVWGEFELGQISKICAKYECMIISDEIHADIVYGNKKHLPFYEIDSNAVSLFSPTKSFNLPGLNIAYAVIKNEKIKKQFERVAHAMHIALPNIFGIEALKSAYFEGDCWLDELLVKLQKNRDFIEGFFEDKKYAWFYTPEATYLGWIDFAPSGLEPSEIRHKLLEEAKVGLSGGDFFFGGKPTTFHRINFATSVKNITKALNLIDKVFKNKT